MTDERWQDIKAMVIEKFEVLLNTSEDLSDGPGVIEILEFVSPLGKVRLERTDRPLVLGKKTIGSKRIGSETTVQFEYSETERTHKFRALKWDPDTDSWQELALDKGAFSF